MNARRRRLLVSLKLLSATLLAPIMSPLLALSASPSDTVLFRDPQGQFDAARFDTLTANALRVLFDEAAAKGLPTVLMRRRWPTRKRPWEIRVP